MTQVYHCVEETFASPVVIINNVYIPMQPLYHCSMYIPTAYYAVFIKLCLKIAIILLE